MKNILTYPQFVFDLFSTEDVKKIMDDKVKNYGWLEFYSSKEKQEEIYKSLLMLFEGEISREEFIEILLVDI